MCETNGRHLPWKLDLETPPTLYVNQVFFSGYNINVSICHVINKVRPIRFLAISFNYFELCQFGNVFSQVKL